METLNFLLDLVLIGAAVWAIVVVRELGGLVGKAFNSIMWGMVFLGIAHLSETITFEVLQLEISLVEFMHRIIVLIGIGFLVLGFRRMQRIRSL